MVTTTTTTTPSCNCYCYFTLLLLPSFLWLLVLLLLPTPTTSFLLVHHPSHHHANLLHMTSTQSSLSDATPRPWWRHPTIPTTRFVSRIAYDGTSFNGWQYQVKSRTIQLEVERALNATLKASAPELMDNLCLRAVAAGRTDAGVHARGQVIHFDFPVVALPLPPAASSSTSSSFCYSQFQTALNAKLPPDVRLFNLSFAPPPAAENVAWKGDWHAMENSRSKLYTYRFSTRGGMSDPLQRRTRATVLHGETMDIDKMKAITSIFEGAHDYQNFANRLLHKRRMSKKGEEFTTVRRVQSVKLIDEGAEEEGGEVGHYRLEVRLDGALQRMVRNMMGALWGVAKGDLAEAELRRALEGPFYEPGTSPIRAAPAHGLTLEWVYYDDY